MSHLYALVLFRGPRGNAPPTRTEVEMVVTHAMHIFDEERHNAEMKEPCFCDRKAPGTYLSDCTTCLGTGIEMHTYNDAGQWDWWQIGGRWSGTLTGYNPARDMSNEEKCFHCMGSGLRPKDLPKQYVVQTSDGDITLRPPGDIPCHICHGVGWRMSWSTEWSPYGGDVQRIRDLDVDDEGKIPFAIVTPDRIWHQDTNQFAKDGSKEKVAWLKTARDILNKNRSSFCAVVDCHS